MRRNETVDELKAQIEELQARISSLDAAGLQTRAACEMHLRSSIQDIHNAAAKLKKLRNELSGTNCASEVAKSLGVLWLGSFLTYWLKTTLKLGHQVSGVMMLVTAVSAALPLGVNGCCCLRKVLLENPKAVDELLQALAVLDQRMNSMGGPSTPPPGSADARTDRFSPGRCVDLASAIPDISTVPPGLVWDEGAAASPISGSEDMVHLVPSDWESPTRTRTVSSSTFNQQVRGTVPVVIDGDDRVKVISTVAQHSIDDTVHVSRAGSMQGTETAVSVDGEQASGHVMMSDSH